MLTQLDTVCQIRRGLPTPESVTYLSNYFPQRNEIVWLEGSNINNQKLKLKEVVITPSAAVPPHVKQFCLRKGAILLVRSGNKRGSICKFEGPGKRFIAGPQLGILMPNIDKVLADYLKYLITNLNLTNGLPINNVGLICLEQLSQYQGYIPDILTQKKIIEILDQIERKIDLNKKTNQTLIEISNEIYKKYFGRAKITESNPPPNWKRISLKEILDIQGIRLDRLEKNKNGVDQKFLVIAPNQKLNTNSETTLFFCENSFNVFSKNDKLPIRVIGFGKERIYPPGTILFRPEVSEDQEQIVKIASSEVLVNYSFIPFVSTKVSSCFLYHWVRKNAQGIENYLPPIMVNNFKYLESFPFWLPDPEQLFQFDNEVAPLFAKIKTTDEETITLRQLFTSLLSRLVTGKLSVTALNL